MKTTDRLPQMPAIDNDEMPTNPTESKALVELIEARYSRRGILSAALAGAAGLAIPGLGLGGKSAQAAASTVTPDSSPSTLSFYELSNVVTKSHRVSPGYQADVLVRWGDPVLPGAPEFDPHNIQPHDQLRQFGYNNDFIAFLPILPGSDISDHGLLCVNHEYTNTNLMFTGITGRFQTDRRQAEVEMAAHGHTIVEIKRDDTGAWQVVQDSPYNRRISPLHTECAISGPAAGHPRMRTEYDPSGRLVKGTLNNCAGGTTPWGTVLIAEENFNKYFMGNIDKLPEAEALKRYGFNTPDYGWAQWHDRFDVHKTPNEPNRFGWIVEFDPYDPAFRPIKRTALGRFRHEGATTVVNHDGRVVVYSGDDQRMEYLYRFVSSRAYHPDKRHANADLLDDGILSVARFDDDGKLHWLPLVFGQGPLTSDNGFHSQADVVIEARRAADLLGATPMDRPEDVEPNPVTGRVFLMLTNNTKRTEEQTDAANPRAENAGGHILELTPPKSDGSVANLETPGSELDHAADVFDWDLFLLAGTDESSQYHPQTTSDGKFFCPDNCTFDNQGRLWIATDQGTRQLQRGIPDGIRATDTTGDGRALTRLFFTCPAGAEMCGPCFTPDNRSMFLAVQHPAEGWGSHFDTPLTRWPDFEDSIPPRPSVVVVTKNDGTEIGG